MTVNVLFSARPALWPIYEPLLSQGLQDAGLDFRLATEFRAGSGRLCRLCSKRRAAGFHPYTRLKAVLSLWAGVESIADNETLTVPLARMVDHGLTQGMTEWVVGHVLRYHLGMDRHITVQDGVWTPDAPPLATERQCMCILGLGALGQGRGQALTALNFQVTGWSRTRPRNLPASPVCMAKTGCGRRCHRPRSSCCCCLTPRPRKTR